MENYYVTIGGMSPPKRTFYLGQWIRCLDLKQVDVAKAADITEGYLSSLISNPDKNPSAEVLLAISEFMELTVNDLYRPPPAKAEMEAARRLSARHIVALGEILNEMNRRQK